MTNENILVQFWCPYCRAWLYQDGTVHSEDHHLNGSHGEADSQRVGRWRTSTDDGKNWTETEEPPA